MENDIIEIRLDKELVSSAGHFEMHIDVSVQKNELFVIFGDSGAGKTTLLRLLAGLIHPDKGFIRIGNKIWLDTEKGISLSVQRRNIGFMFQEYALFPAMTVAENIYFACQKGGRSYADELMSKFGLNDFAGQKPDRLSGGQRQRVALARALARRPEILLLDEPMSSLDLKTRVTLQDEIAAVSRKERMTTFVVSHDLTEVFRLAGKVIKIENGRIISVGRPEEIFVDSNISGKVQITGNVVKIEAFDTFYLLTIVTGINQLVRVIAFEDDVSGLKEGDSIMIFSKAFNPIVMKI